MLRFAATCLVSLLLAASAAGQGARCDYQLFYENNPYLSLSNAAALSFIRDKPVSYASVSFDKENGCLIPLEGSNDDWKVTAITESFRKVSERLSFYGKMEYSHFYGKNMGGPILMEPSFNPIGFLEEDFSARGNKRRETYCLVGGIAYSISNVVSIGSTFNYTSANQVKYKDPRFHNVWMDMIIRPGIFITPSSRFSFGMNLEYRHCLEMIKAKLFGTIDHNFNILVDQGGFYGSKERFEGDSGYISATNDRPLSNSFYGLSLHSIINREVSRYFGQLTALYHNGYYGSRTSSSVVFCEFSGLDIAYTGIFVLPKNKNIHKLSLEAYYSLVNNYTNSYISKPDIGMSNTIVYQGQNKTFSRNSIKTAISYSFLGDSSGYLPKWELNAQAGASCKLQQTTLYPFTRDWNSVITDFIISGRRNIDINKNIISILTSVSFLTGFGTPRKDQIAEGGETTLRSFDNYSDRQFEYETASRIGGGIEFKYSRVISKNLIPFVSLSDSYISLLSVPEYLEGASRNTATLTLGCNF